MTILADENGGNAKSEELEATLPEGVQEGAPGSEDESSDDEVVVLIEGESPPQEEEEEVSEAPKWVKELRKTHKEVVRKNRELEEKLKSLEAPKAEQPVELGAKPTLRDYDYDDEKFEAALEAWHDRKLKVSAQEADKQKQQKATQDAWTAKVEAYNKARTALKVKDYDEVAANAGEVLNATQQGIIVAGSENPALVVYALGKNPKKAAELAKIQDPVQFAFAIAKLEGQLKVSNKRSAPPPEKVVSAGTGRSSGSVDSTLERLRAEAERTGDYSKVIAYKKSKR